MKKFIINSKFSEMKDFTISLPETFDDIGTVILNNRNVIKKVTIPQGTFVVKNFKGMYFFNRLGYTLFSRSKAEKSYRNSDALHDRGIATPPHVAWIDYYNWGFLARSYFVSTYSPYETLREVITRKTQEGFSKESLYLDLLKFINKLHSAGVYHDDFSLSNILVIPSKDGYQFSLVDLNRIRFMKISFRQGLRNFSKLEVPEDDLNMLIREYAVQAGQSAEESFNMFQSDNKRAMLLRRSRKTLRRYTLTPLEKLFKEGITIFKQQKCNAS